MSILEHLNKDFESRVRLGIMSVLMVNEEVDFLEMKEHLEVTDGNLASHVGTLESRGYLEVQKEFVGKKTRTTYRITPKGRQAFEQHLNALEKLLNR